MKRILTLSITTLSLLYPVYSQDSIFCWVSNIDKYVTMSLDALSMMNTLAASIQPEDKISNSSDSLIA